MTKKLVFGLSAVAAAILLLSGCGEREQELTSSATGETSETVAQPSASTPGTVTGPAPAQSAAPTDVHLSLTSAEPLMPLKGTVDAYTITSVTQFTIGQFADAFLGDYVLENDLIKAVISKPEKEQPAIPIGGNLIDLVSKKNPVDYMNYMQCVPDADSTRTQIVYYSVDPPSVKEKTTASLTLRGSLVEQREGDPVSAPLHRIEALRVATTYELPKDKNYLVVTTRFTNDTGEPFSISPGDLVDWGVAQTFAEGLGLISQPVFRSVNWSAGVMDDFSAGIITSGTQRSSCSFGSRMASVRAVGEFRPQVMPPPAQETPTMETPTPLHMRPSPQLTPTPVGYVAPTPVPETSYSPASRTTPAPEKRVAPAIAPTLSATPAPSVSPAPGGESVYRAPAPVNREHPRRPGQTSLWRAVHNKGGGAESRGKDGPPAELRGRITLQPGQSYEYVRYIAVSDQDLSRIADLAYEVKGVTTGTIAGIVLENEANQPLAGAEVRVSGGPDWSGDMQPRAFIRVLSRKDGTFVAHVPYGNYLVSPFQVGRERIPSSNSVQVMTSYAAQLVPLVLGKKSTVRVAVAEADAPSSVPLPCKVTLVSRPGAPFTPTIDWGFGPDITKGVRNVFYLSGGAAEMPVSPGRYQMFVSRGIEYDVVMKDLTVTAGSTQRILVDLPHVVKTPGMIAMDAGVMTNASSVSNISPVDRVRMAACEGVPIIISGDYNVATDLQPYIKQLGLEDRVRAFMGMRFLVSKEGFTADILVYPVAEPMVKELHAFYAAESQWPPDIFLADLKKKFPSLIIEIDRPCDPERGYLSHFPFDMAKRKFEGGNMPPPDFDALQLVEGNRVGMQIDTAPRYYQLLIARANGPSGAPPLAGVAGSNSRLPYGEEVGSPRTYLYTDHDTIDRITADDIVNAVRGQRIAVSNGPIPVLSVREPGSANFNKLPGDVVDLATTTQLVLKLHVLAAPWVGLSGVNVNFNGLPTSLHELGRPTRDVDRYPVRKGPNTDLELIYCTEDVIMDVLAYSKFRSLSPIVPANPPDLGGEVTPLGWTGPIYIDKNGDGRITPKHYE